MRPKKTEKDKKPSAVPEVAMVLAAGEGRRLRPITEKLPKALVAPDERSLLDRILDRLEAAGIGKAVINLFYLGHLIEQHLSDRPGPTLVFSHEDTLLDTGGGIKKALPELGEEAFFAINGDTLWLDGLTPALRRLAAAWDGERMDALLLQHPTAYAPTYEGVGDFFLSPQGVLRRRREREVAPFVFAGVQILHPRLFADTPEGSFSLNLLYDRAAEAERLFGLRHDGEWYEIGTPEALRLVEEELRYPEVQSVHR